MNSLLFLLLTPLLGWVTDAQNYEQQQYTQKVMNTPPGAPLPEAPQGPTGGTGGPDATTASSQEAVYFLSLLDTQQYGSSWLAAGNLFRDLISQNQWVAAMQTERQSLGNMRNRKIGTQQQVRLLPNGTIGNFVIVKYQTNFTNKSNVTETLVLTPEGNLQQWKVISYKTS